MPVSENEALQIQNMLKDIGDQGQHRQRPARQVQRRQLLTKHEFDLIAFTWMGTAYPFTGVKQLLRDRSESNFAQLSMPDVDKLTEQIQVETDPAKRIDQANQAARSSGRTCDTLPLYQRPELIAVKAKLANYGAFGLRQPSTGRTSATRSRRNPVIPGRTRWMDQPPALVPFAQLHVP